MAPVPRALNYKLNDKKVVAAKPEAKPYPLTDGGGLFLDVLPSGSKVWRYSYRNEGKRTKVTIGPYPTIGIKTARDAHENLRGALLMGVDPARQKQLDKSKRLADSAKSQTFETFADIWISEKLALLTARSQKQTKAWLKNDVFPIIGTLPLGNVHAKDILKLLERLRNTPTKANNIRAIIERIFQYAAQKLLVTVNPAAAMRGLIDQPPPKHYRHLQPGEIPNFIEAVRTCRAHQVSKLAVEFLMLTVVRKDNVCKARWAHIDLASKTWTIPGRTVGANGYMKSPKQHMVHLSKQAIALLGEAWELSEESEWVFPSVQSLLKPMTEVALNHLFARLRASGNIPLDFAPHGLRGTASTMMNEHGFAFDVVESILAHKDRDATRASYNHATYAKAIAEALQWYADRLDQLASGANVVTFHSAA